MTNKPLLIFTVDCALLEQLDAYRYKHHFPNRALAIKYLLRAALAFNPKPEPTDLVPEERRPRMRRK